MKSKIFIFLVAAFLCASCSAITQKAPIESTKKVVLDIAPIVRQPMDIEKLFELSAKKEETLSLSRFTKIYGDTAYIKMNDIDVFLATALWSDFIILGSRDDIKVVVIYMSNPGGDAFRGLGIADNVLKFRRIIGNSKKLISYASGIVGSAAVPVYLCAKERVASKNTMFLVHPASLFKYGLFKENLKDLKSQTTMLRMMRNKYANIIVSNSNLAKKDVESMMDGDTWFDVYTAKKFGMVDRIE